MTRTRTGNSLTAAEVLRAAELLDDGCSLREVARTLGRSRGLITRRFPGRGWSQVEGGRLGGIIGRSGRGS